MTEQVLSILKLFGVLLLLLAIASCLEGSVLYCLWEWFVVPLGLKSVSVSHAIGLAVLLNFITYQSYDYEKSEQVGLVKSISYIFIRPIVVYIVGYIVHYVNG